MYDTNVHFLKPPFRGPFKIPSAIAMSLDPFIVALTHETNYFKKLIIPKIMPKINHTTLKHLEF